MTAQVGWRGMTVGDLVGTNVADVRTGPFGTQLRASDYVGNGTPVINVRNLGFGAVRNADIDYVDDLTVRRLSGHVLLEGDIVFGRKGAVERHVLISARENGWVQGSDCIRLRLLAGSPVSPRFLSFSLLTPSHKAWMHAHCSHGATMASLNQDIVKRIPLRFPESGEQRRIESCLQQFNELLSINERRVELLEDLARTLYREWFVRFRYQSDNGSGGAGSAVHALPATWERATLADVTSVVSRGIAPTYSEEGRWLVINQKCIRDQRLSLRDARRHARDVPEAKRLRLGDVVINSTGVGTLGRVAAVLSEPRDATVDSHVTIARASSATMRPWFILHMLGRQAEFEAMGAGSTGQTELSRKAVGELELTVPDDVTMTAFGTIVRPLLASLPELMQRSAALAAIRDLLLPRLVTGRLDISDVDLGDLLDAEAA